MDTHIYFGFFNTLDKLRGLKKCDELAPSPLGRVRGEGNHIKLI